MTRKQIYNQIVNLFWTAVCFAPVVRLWYLYYQPMILIATLAISIVPGLIPARHFNILQRSGKRGFYERLRIKSFQSLTQDGRLISTLAGNQSYRLVKKRSLHGEYGSQIAMYEKFHWSCLVFFSISLVYAVL